MCGAQGSAKLYFQNTFFLQSSKGSMAYGSEDFTQLIAQNRNFKGKVKNVIYILLKWPLVY